MQEPQKKFLLIPVEFRDGLVQYLQEKPFREVAAAVVALQSLPEAQTAPAPAPAPKEG